MQINKGEGGFCKIEGDLMSLGHMAGCGDVEKGEGCLGNDNWKRSI